MSTGLGGVDHRSRRLRSVECLSGRTRRHSASRPRGCRWGSTWEITRREWGIPPSHGLARLPRFEQLPKDRH
jgi:hypothetical protein